MNGMKHVPASVISSARIRDLLEIDNVAQGAPGSRSEGSVCRHSASAVFVEFERTLIQERIRAGIAKAKASGTKSGRPFGRPTIDNARQLQIEALLRDGHGIRKVARMTGSGNGEMEVAA
jgi:DNA invertase Pin-like site-specific DNA recombinase